MELNHVVLYLHSTSNHNLVVQTLEILLLYYIFILHQTTTFDQFITGMQELYYIFILHQTTTIEEFLLHRILLYYIFILHQTTTQQDKVNAQQSCIISSFYIKPQPILINSFIAFGCIISSFYIKPQRGVRLRRLW